MNKYLGFFIIIALSLSACGQAITPTATPDIVGTTSDIVGTMVAGTLTAAPTFTTAPSNTPMPTGTFTPVPTETVTPEPSQSPTALSIASATAWSGVLSPGDTEGLPTGALRIENNSGVKEILVSLSGVTLTRSKVFWLSYPVTGSLNLVVLWAQYQYVIQIPNKRIMTGSFKISNDDKTTIRVYLNKVVITGP